MCSCSPNFVFQIKDSMAKSFPPILTILKVGISTIALYGHHLLAPRVIFTWNEMATIQVTKELSHLLSYLMSIISLDITASFMMVDRGDLSFSVLSPTWNVTAFLYIYPPFPPEKSASYCSLPSAEDLTFSWKCLRDEWMKYHHSIGNLLIQKISVWDGWWKGYQLLSHSLSLLR